LLEAGGGHNREEDTKANYAVPAFHARSTEDADLRWDYYVRHYDDFDDFRLSNSSQRDEKHPEWGIWYPRAGTLGGCTAHNAMITICPHESDWNRIADLTKDVSWSSDKMRKYFQLVERCQYCSLPWDRVTSGFHGFTDGFPPSGHSERRW
jgi:choline dehydrogenase